MFNMWNTQLLGQEREKPESRMGFSCLYSEVTFTKSADYNLPITCAVNICGALQDLAGSKARQVACRLVRFFRTNVAEVRDGKSGRDMPSLCWP